MSLRRRNDSRHRKNCSKNEARGHLSAKAFETGSVPQILGQLHQLRTPGYDVAVRKRSSSAAHPRTTIRTKRTRSGAMARLISRLALGVGLAAVLAGDGTAQSPSSATGWPSSNYNESAN